MYLLDKSSDATKNNDNSKCIKFKNKNKIVKRTNNEIEYDIKHRFVNERMNFHLRDQVILIALNITKMFDLGIR